MGGCGWGVRPLGFGLLLWSGRGRSALTPHSLDIRRLPVLILSLSLSLSLFLSLSLCLCLSLSLSLSLSLYLSDC